MVTPTASASPQPQSIDLGDPASVKRWCKEFGVTEAQLAEAVQAVGGDAAAVREHLLNQGASEGAG
jgi:hypothetical protein